ncbi:hypothetical protein BV898_01509 [Hypsibius exemplaris]|uniref:Uncharacterized protein n=1 Tax=Hypsibius exemplaris TaxID=2072580 RepID=A0A1W0XA86_HYPEX|nr:hypothetical protein BV898_01509 [Hypsibius exemplaris]
MIKTSDFRASRFSKTSRKSLRVRNQNTPLISSSLHYEVLHADGHETPEKSLVPYAIQQPIVPEKTQDLVRWLKRPVALEAEKVMQFVPDPEADSELRKAQQTAMEIKISRLFEGNKRSAGTDEGSLQNDLLSPFTQYFLRNRDIRQEETAIRRALDSLKFDLTATNERKRTIDEKRNLVNDYVKWIDRQIHVSTAVRDQTARRAARDQRQCERAIQNRMEYIIKITYGLIIEMMIKRVELRKAFRARKKWRLFMAAFEEKLGKTFYDITDFCGFYEMAAAVLKLCTEMQDSERLQLDTAHCEAEIKPEEWEAEKANLEERLRERMSMRNRLATELIELQNLNQFHKNVHESDREEWERLVEGVDDISFSIRSLTGTLQNAFPQDNLQRLEAYERFLIVTGRVERRFQKLLGPQLDYDNVFRAKIPDEKLVERLPDPTCDLTRLPNCYR